MYLSFSISNSVTQEEWDKVYKKTLYLADKLNLADWSKFYYKGIRSYAYCKVKEQTEIEFGKKKHFWLACGDYDYIGDGEYFRLEKELKAWEYNENAGPGILGKIDSYTHVNSEPYENQTRNRTIRIYRGTYYIRILAILCYMESLLKDKMFISGDIYTQECEDAIGFVNQYVKRAIEVPARCNFNRLYEIVKKIDIPEEEKLYLMENAYLGKIDLKYKKSIEEKFDKNVIKQFWKNRFKGHAIGSDQFKKKLEVYLSYGFDFKDLFSYITFSNTKEEYTKFMELIFEIESNKSGLSRYFGLSRDPNDNKVRGFSLEFKYSLFGPEGTKIDNFLNIDDYVNELSKYMGKYINVRSFFEEKLKEEDESTVISKLKKFYNEDNYTIFKGEEKYDIIFSNRLMYYKPGDKISPKILEDIKKEVRANKKRLSGKEFRELEKKEPTEQIYELIDIRHQFPVRDIDWFHAIDDFNTNPDALKRYYPLFRMKFDLYTSAEDIAKAIFLNDDFYEFCKSL